jgi:putative glutathione S-transferase
MTVVDPVRDERGWAFREGPGHGPDPVCGFQFLAEAYLRTDPAYTGRHTVPCVWDTRTGRLVTNNYPDLTVDLETQWTAFHRPARPTCTRRRCARDRRGERARLRRREQRRLQGRLRDHAGAYEPRVTALFARLDWLEARLAGQRYLVGGQLTEADVRLFTTLARFDAVYVGTSSATCGARRLPQPVGLRARPLPAPGVRRDGRLRPHQAALLHDARPPEPVAHRPAGRWSDWAAPHDRARLG